MINISSIFAFLILFFASKIQADDKKLFIPRFVSIKANEVNVRSGPTTKSTIKWVFVKKGEPVEVIAEHQQWRQVRDVEGEIGWIHSSVLSRKRAVIITSKKEVELKKSIKPDSKLIARLGYKLRCWLKKCESDYCKISCKNYVGWVPNTVIWGVYRDKKEY